MLFTVDQQRGLGKWATKGKRFCDRVGTLIVNIIFFVLYVIAFINIFVNPKCFAQSGNLVPMFRGERGKNRF